MYRLVSAKSIGPEQWNRFCSKYYAGKPEYSYEYLSALGKRWMLVFPKAGSEPCMPLFFRNWDILYLFPICPIFLQKLPVHPDYRIEDLINFFKTRFIAYSLPVFCKEPPSTMNTIKRVNLFLELNHNKEELWKGFSTNLKRNIKKSFGSQFNMVQHHSTKDFINGYKQSTTNEQWSLNSNAEATLMRLDKLNGLSFIIDAKEGSETLASALFLYSQHRMVYLLGYTKLAGREKQAMAYLFWFVIQQHVNQQKVLDFEGGNLPGLYQFFNSFGPREEYFYIFEQSKAPSILKLFRKFKY